MWFNPALSAVAAHAKHPAQPPPTKRSYFLKATQVLKCHNCPDPKATILPSVGHNPGGVHPSPIHGNCRAECQRKESRSQRITQSLQHPIKSYTSLIESTLTTTYLRTSAINPKTKEPTIIT